MSKRLTPIVLVVSACSGSLSLSGLTGSAPAASSTSSASPSAPAVEKGAGEESYSLADPPGYPKAEDATILTVPKFFQAHDMHWAVARGAWKAFWLADVLGDELSESARMVLVRWCAREDKDLTYIACMGDAHRLDRKKLLAELEDPDAKKYRASALENFDEVVKLVAERDAAIAKRTAEDPALQQIFHTIPGQVWKQWDGVTATNAKLLATARRLEVASQKPLPMAKHGPSRKAYAGCVEELTPAFTAAVKTAGKAEGEAGQWGIARTPETYLATLAMYYCARGQELAVAGALGLELTEDAMLRGPRMATIEAVLAKSHTLKFDDASYKLADQVWRDSNYINEDEELYGDRAGGHGVIKAIERHGDSVHVSFVKEQIAYDECTRREAAKNEWHYDRSTGNISPVTYCVASVTKHEIIDVKPIDVPATEAGALQPGRFLDYQRTHERHAVRAVWDSPKRSKLLALYGIARG